MTHVITSEIAGHGYLAVFLLMLIESACIPVPSEVVMAFGGALAGGLAATAGHPHVTLLGIGLAGVAGNLVGALISYGVGRVGGRPLIERYGRFVHLRTRHLERAEAFFARRGPLAVLIGRLLPVVRTFVSLPAGVSAMPVGRFGAYTVLGSLPWCFALAGAGDALAAHWASASHVVELLSVAIVALAIVALVAWVRRTRAAGRTPAQPELG